MSRRRARAWGYTAVWLAGYVATVWPLCALQSTDGWPLWALLAAPVVPPSLVLLWWAQLPPRRRREVLAGLGALACLVVLGVVLWAVYGGRVAGVVSR